MINPKPFIFCCIVMLFHGIMIGAFYKHNKPTVIHDTIIKPQYLCFVVDDFKPCEVDVDYLASLSLD